MQYVPGRDRRLLHRRVEQHELAYHVAGRVDAVHRGPHRRVHGRVPVLDYPQVLQPLHVGLPPDRHHDRVPDRAAAAPIRPDELHRPLRGVGAYLGYLGVRDYLHALAPELALDLAHQRAVPPAQYPGQHLEEGDLPAGSGQHEGDLDPYVAPSDDHHGVRHAPLPGAVAEELQAPDRQLGPADGRLDGHGTLGHYQVLAADLPRPRAVEVPDLHPVAVQDPRHPLDELQVPVLLYLPDVLMVPDRLDVVLVRNRVLPEGPHRAGPVAPGAPQYLPELVRQVDGHGDRLRGYAALVEAVAPQVPLVVDHEDLLAALAQLECPVVAGAAGPHDHHVVFVAPRGIEELLVGGWENRILAQHGGHRRCHQFKNIAQTIGDNLQNVF